MKLVNKSQDILAQLEERIFLCYIKAISVRGPQINDCFSLITSFQSDEVVNASSMNKLCRNISDKPQSWVNLIVNYSKINDSVRSKIPLTPNNHDLVVSINFRCRAKSGEVHDIFAPNDRFLERCYLNEDYELFEIE
ncbi:MAG: hypothetical protein ACRCXZ_01900 [Patescibacteria group bacterium]